MKKWIAAFLAAVMLLPAGPVLAQNDDIPFTGLGERFTVQKISREDAELYQSGIQDAEGFIQRMGITRTEFLETFSVSPFSEGLAAVYVRDIEKAGYINQDGEWAIEPKFDFVSNFENGLAIVTYHGRELIIDSKGNFVYRIPEGFYASGFDGGVTALLGNSVEEGDNLIFLDSSLQETYRARVEFNFYYMLYNQFSDELFSIIEINKDTGAVNQRFVDKAGETVVAAPEGSIFNSFRYGYAYGQLGNNDSSLYRMDTTGKIEKTKLTIDQIYDYSDKSPYLFVQTDTEFLVYDYITLEPLFTVPSGMARLGAPGTGWITFVELDEEGSFTDTCYFVTDKEYQAEDKPMVKTSFPAIDFQEIYDTVALKVGDSRIYMNGETTLMDTAAFIQDERTFIPVRALAEKLGYSVLYDDETKTVLFFKNDRRITMTLGSTNATVEAPNLETFKKDTYTVIMDVAPFIVNDRTVIPARYFGELAGYTVNYLGELVIITDDAGVDFDTLSKAVNASFIAPDMAPAEYPRVDGSTATLPLSYALAERMLGITNAEDFISHTKTTNAYKRLINKEVDMLVTGTPVQSILDLAKESGVEFEVYNLAKEGFVFLLNADNPVDNLTEAQIQDIYQGKITNWKDAGGEDAEIVAYQRNKGAGSQNLMESLVMRDKSMMEAKTEKTIDAMSGIVDVIADYDNTKYSIGYSVYYYFTEMYNKETVKLPAVNGVKPTPETISSGEYPYTLDYCIVIRKDEPADSSARKLIAFLQSEEGKQLVTNAGFINTAQ